MPGGPPGGPPGPTRLAELLDFVKHEVDALSSEATGLKNQNAEYEQHSEHPAVSPDSPSSSS
jgi:cell division septum initiation protein DivIVA